MSDSEAIPGASRLRNQNEILIEKSDEALRLKNSLNGYFIEKKARENYLFIDLAQ